MKSEGVKSAPFNASDALVPSAASASRTGISKRRINDGDLDERNYLATLSVKAAEVGILTDEDLCRIRSELLALLAYQSDRFTRGKSSSVTAETAVKLAESVFFAIGVRLKREGIPDRAAELLRDVPVQKLFDEGVDIDIRRMMTAARRLQSDMLEKLFETPNVFWSATVRDGIDGFFRLYRPQFGANEIHITADYPLLCGRPSLCGIEFVLKYLRGLSAENELLAAFSAEAVHRLLSEAYGDYAESPVNLCEPVLAVSLGLVLSDCKPYTLELSREQKTDLFEKIRTNTQPKICAALDGALTALGELLRLSARTEGYLRRALPQLSAALKAAVDIRMTV